MLGGRSPRLVIESALTPAHYVALARMVKLYPDFPAVAKRYFAGGGHYPWPCRIRTPTGEVAPTTYTHHDIFTVHEIFGREDYRAGPDLGVVVDIGSNIGISALYMLTRNRSSRCFLFEPVPRNAERLCANLTGYESRYELTEAAVAPTGGTVRFTVEETGRYGGIGVAGTEQIDVECLAVADVLGGVLEREATIDLLKIDTEGAERSTIAAIGSDLLARIRTICFETREPFNPDPERFAMSFACETCRLDQKQVYAPALSARS
jgi:FkbM family methyltransferase